MLKSFIYKFIIAICILMYASSTIAQTAKIPIEIHIKDKEAIISIDGTPYPGGKGKQLYNIEVSPGKHTISATKTSHTVVSKTVNVSSTNYASRIIQLASPKPMYGAIMVTSEPTGLEVILDNKPTGKKTPCILDSILIGNHSISLEYIGYKKYLKTFAIEENDTITASAILEAIAVKSTTPQQSTQRSTYSSYPSQRTTPSYSYGSSSYSSEKKEPEEKKDIRIMYFGIGGAVGTTFSAHVSIFNIRYKRFEFRPCVWGVGGTIYAPIMHSKLPPALVHIDEKEDYYWDDSYNVARPSKGAQWFYTPTIRWHIPIREGWSYFIIGFGPQFSWTKTKWDIDYYPLSWLDNYQYTTDPFPYDSYSYDGTWFTCEIALNWKFGEKMDFETFLRYQDGLVFGLECKFGNEYSSLKKRR